MPKPRATLLVPLYEASHLVPDLIASIAAQVASFDAAAFGPMRILCVDNASTDATVTVLHEHLTQHGLTNCTDILVNPENLGLAKSLNRGLAAVTTDFVVTCHADCRFATPGYVTTMVALLVGDDSIAAATGVPMLDAAKCSRVDRLYAASNLMDLADPGAAQSDEVVDVGFAEGRCDIFRMDAMRRAGFYDTRVRLAGEDQLLAARCVAMGYRVVQHRGLVYFLGLSPQQDSLRRVIAHQRRLGQPIVLLVTQPGVLNGATGERAGRNRRSRSLLRMLQLASAGSLALMAVGVFARRLFKPALMLFALIAALRQWQMQRAGGVSLTPGDRAMLVALQPVLDVAWATGFAEGAASYLTHRHAPSIAVDLPNSDAVDAVSGGV